MRLLLLAGLSLATATPIIPKQTAEQSRVVKLAAASAASHARTGTRQLLGRLTTGPFRKWLKHYDDGSALHLLPPTELLARITAELNAAELVHAFGGGHGYPTCGTDITFASGVHQPYFYNEWMLKVLGLTPAHVPFGGKRFDQIESTLFGFHPFANASKPDEKTAESRPLYTALNMFRSAAGNPQCGPVSAVMSRHFVGDQAIVSPMDTGAWSMTCDFENANLTYWCAKANPHWCVDCTAWEPGGHGEMGVPSSLLHLLPIYVDFWNTSFIAAGAESPPYNLARMVIRLLSRRTYRNAVLTPTTLLHPNTTASGTSKPAQAPLSLNWVESGWGYLEVDLGVTVQLPQGIKMMIGSFDAWFGTWSGDRLRAWCVARGWPLAWAHEPSMLLRGGSPPTDYDAHGIEPSAMRVLDPFVLSRVPHAHNYSIHGAAFAAAAEVFARVWDDVNRTVNASLPARQRIAALDPRWLRMLAGNTSNQTVGLAKSVLAVEPVFAGACAEEACVGVRILDGACVCP